ncbi:MAG TPA: hypothetical protein VK277_01585 [Acidimicrobiales bacterium]|nr:hypothetical protein [Acidimicrobiales bacterium]
MAAWTARARPVLQEAVLTRSMLVQSGARDEPGQRQSVDSQVDRTVTSLTELATSAPDDASRLAAASSAEAIRGLLFALEAERLLRTGPTAPTGQQLAEADQARRTRAGQLDAALAALNERLGSPTPGAPPPPPPPPAAPGAPPPPS